MGIAYFLNMDLTVRCAVSLIGSKCYLLLITNSDIRENEILNRGVTIIYSAATVRKVLFG